MRVIVTHDNLAEVLAYLCSLRSGTIAFDTETYGLKWDDKLFALQLAVQGGDSFYFNFHSYPTGEIGLPGHVFISLHDLWRNDRIRWIAHNAKFDMRRLDIEGVTLAGEVWDTMIGAHIEYNKHFSYSLDNCLKRIGFAKNDEVALWIRDNKAYTTYHVEGKKTKEKDLHFDRVPFAIMSKYGLDDVELTLKLYEHQNQYFNLEENQEQFYLLANEMKLVKAVYNMEREGIKVNLEYCNSAYAHCMSLVNEAVERIEDMTSQQFKNGPKWLKEVLSAQDIELQLSEKGNPILDKKKLKSMDNAIASNILEMRDKEKEATFYSTFQRYADNNGILHPNYRLTGTDTGRFSCSEPNIQQAAKDPKNSESNPFTVRGAFEAGDGNILVSIDYSQMEYRIMADYAGEHSMIAAIKGGLDPHTFVGNMMGVDRSTAKTLNFGLLYSMGIAKLAASLNITEQEARELKNKYYSHLPNVQRLTRQVQDVAIGRGYIKNRYNRRYFLDDPKWAYKMTNYLIQGTGADVVRHVIPKVSSLLEGTRSAIIMQLHDELVFRIDRKEIHLVPSIKAIMENEYIPMNGMNLECDCEWSPTSWRTSYFKDWSEYA